MSTPSPAPRPSSEKMVRHAGAVSVATLLSRLLGYARDALVANAFGGGHLTDAFYAAFRLSNLFRRILGEGPLATAFVPVFSDHLARKERAEANNFFYTLFTFLTVLLLGIVALGILGSPWIVSLAAGGFKTADLSKYELTVRLTRQLFPFLLFVCLAALSSAALNALGYFFIPSLAPAMLSVATIVYILFIHRWTVDPIQGLAISTTVGGILHFLMLWPQLKKEGLLFRWKWNPRDPDVRRVGWLVLPSIWGLSIDQVNAYVDTICASFLAEGSVTALYNSNRLMQFSLALFGVSLSTATLPHLALSAAKGDWDAFKENLNFSIRLTLYMVVPATVGMVLLARPLVQLLFEHGRFTAVQTGYTAAALAAYTLGLPAYSLVKVVVTAFYAQKDTRTPVRVATLCLFINMVGNVVFMHYWGVGGLAFATTLASFVNVGVLVHFLRKKIGLMGGRRIGASVLQMTGASLAMAGVSLALLRWAPGALALRTLAAVGGGAVVYIGLTRLLKMDEYTQMMSLLRRRRGGSAALAD